MENKLPQKYKENFFSKILKNIKKLFTKKTIKKVETEKAEIGKLNVTSSVKNVQSSQTNSCKRADFKLKEDIMAIVESNHDLLQTLPYKRLEQLDSLYDEEIEKNNKEIEYLDYQLKKVVM